MNDLKLVACPFCGGEATQYYSAVFKGIYTGCPSVGNESCDFEPFCVSAQRKQGASTWNKAGEENDRLKAINAELLEACKQSLDWFAAEFQNVTTEEWDEYQTDGVHKILKAAIANAKQQGDQDERNSC